jgi:nucleotide-binding universal stress UspA family protein
MPIGVYSVTAGDDAAKAGESILTAAAEVAQRHAAGIEVATELRAGGAASALIDASATAGLLVVGSRGLGGFTGLLLGSVSAQVSAHAHCPTVVVRGQGDAAGPVVLGVDGSRPARAASAFAFAEAHRLGVGVVAVYAWNLPLPAGPSDAVAVALLDDGGVAQYQQQARQVLTDALADARRQYPHVPVEERLADASPVRALLDASTDPAMIVVGARGHGGFTGLLLGSTSQSVLHHADCPVAVLHDEEDPGGHADSE